MAASRVCNCEWIVNHQKCKAMVGALFEVTSSLLKAAAPDTEAWQHLTRFELAKQLQAQPANPFGRVSCGLGTFLLPALFLCLGPQVKCGTTCHRNQPPPDAGRRLLVGAQTCQKGKDAGLHFDADP